MKSGLKLSWIVIALAALVVTAGPALARGKYRHPARCADRAYQFSLPNFIFGFNPEPRPNGCAPPVYSDGIYLGQDPDPFIRYGLARDPDTGYANPNQD